MRNSISHPNNDLEGIHSVAQPDQASLSRSPEKTTSTREITSLTGSSSHEATQSPRDVLAQSDNCHPYRGMDDSKIEQKNTELKRL